MPPLAASLPQSAAVERAESLPLPDVLMSGIQGQGQQLLSMLSQVHLPALQQAHASHAQEQPQQQQHASLPGQHASMAQQHGIMAAHGMAPQQATHHQEVQPLMLPTFAVQTLQSQPALLQGPLPSLAAQPSDPDQRLEADQQQQQQPPQQQQLQALSQLPLPDTSLLPLSGAGHGAGLSDILSPRGGPPSWLGPDVHLCPAVPAGNKRSGSPSSEVEQPSPTRADPPAQRHACEEHPHRAPGHRPQQAQQAQQTAPNQPPASAAAAQAQAIQPADQQQTLAGRDQLDPALPGPSKRPRLELQLHPPSGVGGSSMLQRAASACPRVACTTALDSAALAAATAAGAGMRDREEVVPLDTVLEAWEAHDRVNRQLAQAQHQLGLRCAEVAELERKLAAAHDQLAAMQAPESPLAAAAAALPAPAAAATMAAAAAVQAQLSDLRVLLPRSVRLQLTHLLSKQPELQPHAAAACDLVCQAVEAALAAYANSLTDAAAATNTSMVA